jgi:hypothetical protein
VAQSHDLDLLARAIAWAGEAASARNEIFNITNGDVFVWENIWPAIAASFPAQKLTFRLQRSAVSPALRVMDRLGVETAFSDRRSQVGPNPPLAKHPL